MFPPFNISKPRMRRRPRGYNAASPPSPAALPHRMGASRLLPTPRRRPPPASRLPPPRRPSLLLYAPPFLTAPPCTPPFLTAPPCTLPFPPPTSPHRGAPP
ncbi:hypothetical protein ABZP36_035599 [Zizania latifolia]